MIYVQSFWIFMMHHIQTKDLKKNTEKKKLRYKGFFKGKFGSILLKYDKLWPANMTSKNWYTLVLNIFYILSSTVKYKITKCYYNRFWIDRKRGKFRVIFLSPEKGNLYGIHHQYFWVSRSYLVVCILREGGEQSALSSYWGILLQNI